MRADHHALVQHLYDIGALADPVLSTEGNRITVSWPNGKGTLNAGLISADLVEELVEKMNNLQSATERGSWHDYSGSTGESVVSTAESTSA